MPMSLLDSLRSIPVAMPVEPQLDGTTVNPASGHDHRSDDHDRSAHSRNWRFRFLGAGALAAGLAVGALVIGVDQDREPAAPGGQLVSGVTSPFVVPVKLDTP